MTTTRRPRGEGSIYPDKDRGGYIGAVRIDGRLRKVRGKTKTEVARKMGRTLDSVKNLWARGLVRLRRVLIVEQ